MARPPSSTGGLAISAYHAYCSLKKKVSTAGSGSAARAAGAPWAKDSPGIHPAVTVAITAKAAPRADRERVMYDSVAKC